METGPGTQFTQSIRSLSQSRLTSIFLTLVLWKLIISHNSEVVMVFFSKSINSSDWSDIHFSEGYNLSSPIYTHDKAMAYFIIVPPEGGRIPQHIFPSCCWLLKILGNSSVPVQRKKQPGYIGWMNMYVCTTIYLTIYNLRHTLDIRQFQRKCQR